jgi:hypothetical protein
MTPRPSKLGPSSSGKDSDSRVSVCMIVGPGRSTEAVRAIDSVKKHVDEVVLVFPCPPSADPHLDLLGQGYATVYEFCPQFFSKEYQEITDFGAARNRSFALASCPWRMWLDSDDEVVGADGIRRFVAKGEAILRQHQDKSGLLYFADYKLGPGRMERERLVRSEEASWIHPVHETIDIPLAKTIAARIDPNVFHVVHLPHKDLQNKPNHSERNLRILRRYQDEHPDDPWARLELGRELIGTCDYAEGIASLRAWLDDERRDTVRDFTVRIILTEALMTLGLWEDALFEINRSCELYPTFTVPKRYRAWITFMQASKASTSGLAVRWPLWQRAKDFAEEATEEREVDLYFASNAASVLDAETMRSIVKKATVILS